jgi:20S proteasome alpha/beta subunit
MTLIAGVKCQDGFLVAADTAISLGDSGMFHGDKLRYYRGARVGAGNYKLVIASAGDLSYAGMACQDIRDAVAALPKFTVPAIKATIRAVLLDLFSKHMYPYWQAQHPEPPDFSIIVAIEVDEHYEVVVSKDTAVVEVDTYVFRGSGGILAQYLAERFLQSGSNSVLGCTVATAVHLITEIFRAVKEADSFVGRDTQIIAWRSSDSYSMFSTPISIEISAIQENVKHALWFALERSSLPNAIFDNTTQAIVNLLKSIQNHTQEQSPRELRFIRYSLSPSTNVWSMADLDPNAGLPS